MSDKDDARLAGIDATIERYRMVEKTGIDKDVIRRLIRKATLCNNMAYILADVCNTFLMDCEGILSKFDVCFDKSDKYNFRRVLEHVRAARKWSEKASSPLYGLSGDQSDLACADSDWWYNLIKLLDDRLGEDARKTNMFLEFVLSMPSEIGLFDVKYEDFKHSV